jgi:CO dehydrogenase nickel-insertion accessory protein CooC1
MARDLGIDCIGAVANKITEPSQVDLIASQLSAAVLLGTVSYNKSVQEADLKRTPVAAADATFVQELDGARQRLLDLVCETSETPERH